MSVVVGAGDGGAEIKGLLDLLPWYSSTLRLAVQPDTK